MGRVNADSRTMLGRVQEDWLGKGLKASVAGGKAWQVLANQVIMARVTSPDFTRTLSAEQKAAQSDYVASLIPFSALGMPYNLDAWDGFPAARDRLYSAAEKAKARLVTLTGDSHTAWANTLHDGDGDLRGVELAGTSVSSPGIGQYVKDVPDLGEMFSDANDDIDWHRTDGHGFMLVTLTGEDVVSDFHEVSTIQADSYTSRKVASFRTRRLENGMTGLERA